MSVTGNRVRFATLDGTLLARKGEARPALTLAAWLEEAGPPRHEEEVSRTMPHELADLGPPKVGHGAAEVALDRLRPNANQPRRRADDAGLAALAASIRAHGVLQPLVVRPDGNDGDAFEIIVGERRWRAARLAGRATVPVLVRKVAEQEAFELALVENLQREDLDPLDEAAGYRRLMDEFGRTQDDVARVVGKSRSHVANSLRLLNLPDEVRGMVRDGALFAGHARAVLAAPEPVTLARRVVSEGLTVRATEALVRDAARAKAPAEAPLGDLEARLGALTGLVVKVAAAGRGGAVTIRLESRAALESLIATLRARSTLATPARREIEDTPGIEGF